MTSMVSQGAHRLEGGRLVSSSSEQEEKCPGRVSHELIHSLFFFHSFKEQTHCTDDALGTDVVVITGYQE